MNILRVSLAIVVLHNSILAAQPPKQVPPAPIPAQILAAKKLFVANAGGEAPWKDNAQFNGGVDRSHSQFYGALKTWGRYELVGAPADADLLFEIRFTVLSVAGDAAKGIGGQALRSSVSADHPRPKNLSFVMGFYRARSMGDFAGEPR